MERKKYLEKYVQERLDSVKETLEADKRGADNFWVKKYLSINQHQRENFEEVKKIVLAREAHNAFDGIVRDGEDAFYDGRDPKIGKLAKYGILFSLRVKRDDPEIVELFNQLRINTYPEILRDEFVQKIYESCGFTEQLPTMGEVKLLQSRLDGISEKNSDEYKSLEKELLLKKCALGMHSINSGLPQMFSTDILTRSLGKETIDQQKDTQAKDALSSQIDTKTQDSIEK